MKIIILPALLSALFVIVTTVTANTNHTSNRNNTIDEKETKELVDFLYKYMPLADKTDYPRSFFEENVNTSLRAKATMPWGKYVPELLFRHFVVPIRVNNENLDNSRMVFYKELKKRVENLSMYEAILEVNHWCHEHVTYQPSDGRTSAPLSTIRSAYGRCGEESTLTVAALRAIGIPARQVYTPRWAHTDDNHAWVEAWADGKWYFLGACEPEPVLNLAWFNAPVSRAMLTHTKAFGDYQGPEEVMLRTSNYTEINLIDNYGESARIDFKIVDTQNRPVSSAKVDFKIYNYAEFCTVVTKYTDKKGETFLSAGKGDMIVWASHNGKYGFSTVSFGKDKSITITLNNSVGTSANIFFHDSLNIIPPPENAFTPNIDETQRSINNRRLNYEDSVRNAYIATFYNTKTAGEALTKNNIADPDSSLSRLLTKSRGNHTVILDFIVKHKDNTARVEKLLSSLSDKDLRDMQPDILEDNFNAKSDQICPRVENEMIISPYKQFFETAFPEKQSNSFKENPMLLVEWIKKNISLNEDKKALQIAQTPIGVWQSKTTDERSRKIFFVSVARSLGIEAQVDPITKKTQYKKANTWIDVDFDNTTETVSPKGFLKLEYNKNEFVDDPKYYYHFTLSHINSDGSTSLLEYPEEGITWAKSFKNATPLDEGDYILVSGTRLADGGVLSDYKFFHISKDDTTSVAINMRTSETEISVIGNFNSETKIQLLNGEEKSILSQTGRGYFCIGLIGVDQEPSNHALKDIEKVAKDLENLKRPILLLFENKDAANKFKKHDFDNLPQNIIFGIDNNGVVCKQISENMKLKDCHQLPIFFIADTFNRVVFISQGYTIGLGERLKQTFMRLK